MKGLALAGLILALPPAANSEDPQKFKSSTLNGITGSAGLSGNVPATVIATPGTGGQAPAAVCPDDALNCRCPRQRRFKVKLYGMETNDYLEEIVLNAALVLRPRNIELSISSEKVLYDIEGKEKVYPMPNMEELCKYVKKAFARNMAQPNEVQAFAFPWGNYRAQLEPGTVAQIYPPGRFAENCADSAYNSGTPVTGLPDNMIIVFDTRPGKTIKQTFVHEMGHVVDRTFAGQFPHDVYSGSDPASVFKHHFGADNNVMLTERSIDNINDIQMTGSQVKAYCDNTYTR